jgi:peptidoglycan/xylan/chitin deacetylase (PgdA/CDA1 family)
VAPPAPNTPPVGVPIRDRAATLLTRLPLRGTLRLLGAWPGVLVLNYHRIGDRARQQWDGVMWNVSAAELDEQLATLVRHAEVIGPEEVPTAISAGWGRRVLLTFDDGYRDNYELAFPLLRRHGLTATFFLASGFIDSPRAAWWDEIAWMVRHACGEPRAISAGNGSSGDGPVAGVTSLLPAGVALAAGGDDAAISTLITRYKTLPDEDGERFLEELAAATGSGRCGASAAADLWMTWEMARELLTAGMSVGGHTVTHPLLARLTAERQREEIVGCARRLREELGVAMRWFAYPVGTRDSFTSLAKELLRDCGVELAFSFYGGFVRPSRWDPLDVPRIHVDPRLTPRLLGSALGLQRILAR